MRPDLPSAAITNMMPDSGVRYPVRLGRSITNVSYHHFAMRFAHLPDSLSSTAAGVARVEDDAINVVLPQDDGTGCAMDGRRVSQGNQKLADYMLVFHDGVIWLERLSASYHNVRVSSSSAPAPTAPPSSGTRPPLVPWLDPPERLSPVTNDDSNSGNSDRADPAPAHKSTPTRQRRVSSRAAKKPFAVVGGVSKPSSRSPSNASRSNTPSPVRTPHNVASKSIAHKTPSSRPARRSQSPSSSSGSSSGSSSSGSDSDSSGDSSGNDSGDYTDGSSDEE